LATPHTPLHAHAWHFRASNLSRLNYLPHHTYHTTFVLSAPCLCPHLHLPCLPAPYLCPAPPPLPTHHHHTPATPCYHHYHPHPPRSPHLRRKKRFPPSTTTHHHYHTVPTTAPSPLRVANVCARCHPTTHLHALVLYRLLQRRHSTIFCGDMPPGAVHVIAHLNRPFNAAPASGAARRA